ncbi:outer membrane beta-barrel protein [Hufsiella ginkgonis]|uniref:TonB-dependent receptor n=1 Tax=Hufsiella ginkgonis TaxID=2695274 RepID=A0A7K1Y3A7_9SPHI|nr:outer membrane beta-barrel protein [Hufsiella ginkgonis]MXV17750.1 TonB-dependent receptor [Hufsiella ginkgonis]
MKKIMAGLTAVWYLFAPYGANAQGKADTSKTSTTNLKEIAVTGQKSLIEQKIDRTVVNVGALITATGATALEVLEQSPGVMVDENGKISFKGRPGVMILIDDKPTYLSGDDLVAYLRSLPASSLDKIELMPNPPAKYDAAGNAGVINIKTKKSKAKGFNGSAAANVGKAKFWRTGESMNLNYRVNKVNVFADIAYNKQNNYRKMEISRRYFNNSGNILSVYDGESFFQSSSDNGNVKLGADYYASDKTTLGIVFTGSATSGRTPNQTTSWLYGSDRVIDSTIAADNLTRNRFRNLGVNLNFGRQLNSRGRMLTADLDHLKYRSRGSQSFLNNAFLPDNSLKSTQRITDNLPADIAIYAVKTDYVHPFTRRTKAEAGLKTSYVNTDNAANYFNVVDNVSTPDYNRTNRFLYKEHIHAGYVNVSKELKRLTLQAGLRAENTRLNGHQPGNKLRTDSSFTQHYTSLFPTAYLSLKMDSSGRHLLNLSYSRRIGRPYYKDLNPFVTILDRYSYISGNPFLRPQFSANYEISYSYKNLLTITALFNFTKDYQVETITQSGGNFISQNRNLGQSVYYGVNATLALKPVRWWSLNIYSEVYYNGDKSVLNDSYLHNHQVYLLSTVNNQFSLGHGWTAELYSFYVTPKTDGQFKHFTQAQVNTGLQKKVLSDKASLKISVRDVFYSNLPGGTITNVKNTEATYHNDFHNRAFTLGFSCNFGAAIKNARKRDTGSAGAEQSRVRN